MAKKTQPTQGENMSREMLNKLIDEYLANGGTIRKVGFPKGKTKRSWSARFINYTEKKDKKK